MAAGGGSSEKMVSRLVLRCEKNSRRYDVSRLDTQIVDGLEGPEGQLQAGSMEVAIVMIIKNSDTFMRVAMK